MAIPASNSDPRSKVRRIHPPRYPVRGPRSTFNPYCCNVQKIKTEHVRTAVTSCALNDIAAVIVTGAFIGQRLINASHADRKGREWQKDVRQSYNTCTLVHLICTYCTVLCTGLWCSYCTPLYSLNSLPSLIQFY